MSGAHEPTHHTDKKRAATISLFASFGLSVAKFAAAILTGSLGMLSEAIHSLVDMGATLVTLVAIKWADQPADDDHHYGHEKIESVAALFESGLLMGTAAFIAVVAVRRLQAGNVNVEVTWWAAALLVVSMLIDFNRSRVLRDTAIRTKSAALAADAKHFESDMWSSLAALIGLAGVWLGWQWTDAVAGLLVSGFIVYIGWGLGRATLASLLDKAPMGASHDISALVDQADGILQASQTRIRTVGSKLFVSVVADVPRMMPVTTIIAVKEKLTADIIKKFPSADVTVTTNPVALDNETAFDKILLLAAQRRLAIHHLTVQQIDGKLAVSFDLEVEGSTTLLAAHALATNLENAIRKSLGTDVEVESHIEPQPLQLIAGYAADAKISNLVESALRLIAKSEKSLTDLHDVRVRNSPNGLFIHYHCRFAASQTIDIVHAAIDRIENDLKKKFRRIIRVIAHAEPVEQVRPEN